MSGSKALNILSLHGKGGNAITFERKLKALVTHFSPPDNQWYFLDAPYILSKDRTRLNTEKRDISKYNEHMTERAWWVLPDGVRSYEATSYEGTIIIITFIIITIITFIITMFEGVEKSIEMIEEQIRIKKIDLLVGHSQGNCISLIIITALVIIITILRCNDCYHYYCSCNIRTE